MGNRSIRVVSEDLERRDALQSTASQDTGPANLAKCSTLLRSPCLLGALLFGPEGQ